MRQLELIELLAAGKKAAGTNEPNFVSNLLESGEHSKEILHNIQWSASSLYIGGADTVKLTGVLKYRCKAHSSPH